MRIGDCKSSSEFVLGLNESLERLLFLLDFFFFLLVSYSPRAVPPSSCSAVKCVYRGLKGGSCAAIGSAIGLTCQPLHFPLPGCVRHCAAASSVEQNRYSSLPVVSGLA